MKFYWPIFLMTLFMIHYALFAQPNSGKWDEVSKNQLVKAQFESVKKWKLTGASKRKYIECYISKFKRATPYGYAKMPKSKIDILLVKFAKECFEELNDSTFRFWTISTEALLFQAFENTYKQAGYSDQIILDMTDCAVTRLINLYPNGLKGKSEKELYDIYFQTGKECGKAVLNLTNIHLKWNIYTEEAILLKLNAVPEIRALADEIRHAFNKCVIDKLKQKFPDGIKKNIEADLEEVLEACFNEYIKQ